jgi:hypothetical protein
MAEEYAEAYRQLPRPVVAADLVDGTRKYLEDRIVDLTSEFGKLSGATKAAERQAFSQPDRTLAYHDPALLD